MKQMLSWFLVFFLLGMGCSTEPSGPALEIDFAWPKGMKSCFDTINPEIRLGLVPEGTRSFTVAVFDTEYAVTHGGGSVRNDGSGLIAKGALTEYRGPCSELALSGPGQYEFTVKALDEKGDVLASGKKTRSYPE